MKGLDKPTKKPPKYSATLWQFLVEEAFEEYGKIVPHMINHALFVKKHDPKTQDPDMFTTVPPAVVKKPYD